MCCCVLSRSSSQSDGLFQSAVFVLTEFHNLVLSVNLPKHTMSLSLPTHIAYKEPYWSYVCHSLGYHGVGFLERQGMCVTACVGACVLACVCVLTRLPWYQILSGGRIGRQGSGF